jgi:hypothetical protein
MKFITDYLTLIMGNETPKDKNTITLIERLCGSKLAILDKNGDCLIIGKGWITENGVMYSNSSFRSYDYAPKGAKTAKTLDYWEDWEAFKDKNGFYDFTPYFCPYFEDGDEVYCKYCKSVRDCFGLNENEDLDDLENEIYEDDWGGIDF